MFRFKDTVLNLVGGLRESLSQIYGVGIQRAGYICDLFGFGVSAKVSSLNRFFFECFIIILKGFFVVDERLRFCVFSRLELMVANGSISGKRYMRGLPKHGQRTHSNGKTPARRLLSGFF